MVPAFPGADDPRRALQAIGQLDDDEIDLAAAAVQLARAAVPLADWRAAMRQLSELAREAVAATPSVRDADLAGRAAALATLLGRRHGYRGDAERYDDLANANLIRVMERRKGLPVALGVLWLHCAHAAGWAAHGLDFPGHFLVALRSGNSEIVVDPFAGGARRDSRDLQALLRRIEGPGATLQADTLRPMDRRAVLLRLQNNILSRLLRANALAEAMNCLETMLLIAPGDARLWRDAALLNQRLDRVGAAIACFERCLGLQPSGAETADLRQAMDELRARRV